MLGRVPDCDTTLGEPTLSTKHCRFVLDAGEWIVHDLGSRSGVIVNGRKMNCLPLKQGDELRLGDLRLKVVRTPA